MGGSIMQMSVGGCQEFYLSCLNHLRQREIIGKLSR